MKETPEQRDLGLDQREPDIDRIAEERFLALQGTDEWGKEKDRIDYEIFKQDEQNYDPKIY